MTHVGLDPDDLALLAAGFEAALRNSGDPADAVAALHELCWGELLAAAPAQAIATAFTAAGTTGSAAGIVDDILADGLGLDAAPGTSVLLSAPGSSAPPARREGDRLLVDAVASSRIDRCDAVLVACGPADGAHVVRVAPSVLPPDGQEGVDPTRAYRRVRAELPAGTVELVDATGTWHGAVAGARIALSFELVAASRAMLEHARQHAVDRVQFGRPVASFQAVRHRLAEALVHIEGAAGVADAAAARPDPLLAALAKSLAGQAALSTAAHAQQVLAGMGFTTDHPFHLRLKRVLVVDALLGSARALPAEIGAELLRRGEAPRLVELDPAPSY